MDLFRPAHLLSPLDNFLPQWLPDPPPFPPVSFFDCAPFPSFRALANRAIQSPRPRRTPAPTCPPPLPRAPSMPSATSPSSPPVHSPTTPPHSSSSICPTPTRISPTPRTPTVRRSGNATRTTTLPSPTHNQSVVPAPTAGDLVPFPVPGITLPPIALATIAPAHSSLYAHIKVSPCAPLHLSLTFSLQHCIELLRDATHSDLMEWQLAYTPHMYLHHTYTPYLYHTNMHLGIAAP